MCCSLMLGNIGDMKLHNLYEISLSSWITFFDTPCIFFKFVNWSTSIKIVSSTTQWPWPVHVERKLPSTWSQYHVTRNRENTENQSVHRTLWSLSFQDSDVFISFSTNWRTIHSQTSFAQSTKVYLIFLHWLYIYWCKKSSRKTRKTASV